MKHALSQHAICENTDGSYGCTCNDGYVGTGVNCSDIDECDNDSACGANSVCENLPGTHNCICHRGYNMVGDDCIDVNECDSNPCHSKVCFHVGQV